MNFTTTEQANLEQKGLTLQAHAEVGGQISDSHWIPLVESEQLLIDLMSGDPPAPDAPGHIELSWVLYTLNHDLPPNLQWLVDVLRRLGMPPSRIQPADWQKWMTQLAGAGVLYGDGTLLAVAPYAQLDPGWLLSAIDYFILKNVHWPIGLHPFANKPKRLQLTQPTSLKIAVLGDCGTGPYQDGNLANSPSQLVFDQIKSLSPDIIIHLGDVYYSGTAAEETKKLVNCWPTAGLGNFTMNSNHEMYDGANGLFKTALGSPAFGDQQKTTYFSVEWGDWLIVGLDSAYYDPSSFFMTGALTDPAQKAFLQQAMATGKKVILMTHHCGMNVTGSATTPLWQNVSDALGGHMPAYWYWGHEHNGIVYGPGAACGDKIECRCLGNAAIPIGNSSWLQAANKSAVRFYTDAPLDQPTPPQALRVKNGFALLELSHSGLTETWYYQDGTQAWQS
ncbi:metallophosphoesterase family protein [Synoicihabitans lomoniglobus]|uniref:Metallophosphoesterase n=1 Tax=Synoicihabitans lomoniglobus TaxID=2909285 RepID=A0AAE9ZY86_9BACT|nr:metallophosphoesterase [Opitutaceae bacterium LMO-M01]WED63373.1 metallophosphoesterase [Opitutaceae bacterium LMO-M01]